MGCLSFRSFFSSSPLQLSLRDRPEARLHRSDGGGSCSDDSFSLSKFKRRRTTQQVQVSDPRRSVVLSQIRDYGSGSDDSLVFEVKLVSDSDSSVKILDNPNATL